MSLLQTNNLSAFYGDFQALFDVRISVEQGETVAIIGANGAGKTTFLRAVAGALPTKPEMVMFDGQPIGPKTPHEVVRLGIAMVPEGRRLFPSLSVEENLLLGGHSERKGPWNLSRVYELFPRLRELRHLPAPALSGGQQQMAAVGRALMANPRLLLCDELSLGLAPVIIRDIYQCLGAITAEGTTVVLVEQDINRALDASARFYCFQEGRLALTAPTKGFDRAAISAAYFGIYGLFAIGLSLSFGIMRLVNIAHGDLIVLSAYVALVVGQGTGLDPISCLIIVVPVMFLVGYALQRGLLNQTLSGGLLPPLLVSFGISIIIQNGLLQGFGAYTHRLQEGAIETASLQFPGGITIGVYPLVVFGVALLALGSLQLLFYQTGLGRAFRA